MLYNALGFGAVTFSVLCWIQTWKVKRSSRLLVTMSPGATIESCTTQKAGLTIHDNPDRRYEKSTNWCLEGRDVWRERAGLEKNPRKTWNTHHTEKSLTGAGSVPPCSCSMYSLQIGGVSTGISSPREGQPNRDHGRLGQWTPKTLPVSSVQQLSMNAESEPVSQGGWKTTDKALERQHQGTEDWSSEDEGKKLAERQREQAATEWGWDC